MGEGPAAPVRHSDPDVLAEAIADRVQADGTLPELPFGSDLEPEERVLGRALRRLRRTAKLRAVIQAAENARTAAPTPRPERSPTSNAWAAPTPPTSANASSN
ncbi:MAG: hypothetical protein ACODAG_10690 [Myxococcota bacterium]